MSSGDWHIHMQNCFCGLTLQLSDGNLNNNNVKWILHPFADKGQEGGL